MSMIISQMRQCNFIRGQGIVALFVLLSLGCLSQRLTNKTIEIEFVSEEELLMSDRRVPVKGLKEFLIDKNLPRATTILFRGGKGISHKSILRVQRVCSSLGHYSFAFAFDGCNIPVNFGCLAEDCIFGTDTNKKIINIAINEDGVMFNNSKISDMRKLLIEIRKIKSQEREVVEITCDKTSPHLLLLQVLEILREDGVKMIYVISR
jgi:biopolymer transport protein ExbD